MTDYTKDIVKVFISVILIFLVIVAACIYYTPSKASSGAWTTCYAGDKVVFNKYAQYQFNEDGTTFIDDGYQPFITKLPCTMIK